MIRGIVSEAIKANYSRLNLLWTEGMIESLTNLRTMFGNDMDKVVVLAVIGQSAQRLMAANRTYDEAVNHPPEDLPANAVTNIQSITDSTGIPRESVRRKVNELIAAGWVTRLEDGSLKIVPDVVSSDLKPVTQKQFVTIDKTVTAIITELEAMKVLKLLAVASSTPPEDQDTPGRRKGGRSA